MAAIVIRRGKLEIEVKDPADLHFALEALGESHLQTATNKAPEAEAVQIETVPVPTDEAFRRFFRGLGGEYSKNFIVALYQHPNGLSDEQVRRLLGLESNVKLAGVSAGIAKGERREGLPPQAAVKRERKGSIGDYSYRYWLTRDCRRALEPLMGSNARHLLIENGGASE